ncbi:putative DNA-binding transcriptional regulator YafY [Roseibium hamelinense]|uniref:Putative DNA-binding transcriptional regulator YafY n=1 Tax=Roseibium hamelinense TaxID=150831 RepID=A0A562T7Y3_9HYPH|nr:YafY family protein [Roseibium hamelinense]MTI43711.1 YafY family transcriptional regulator [Roseibium hamelinense]TWI89393.1 putative DNA-binding transcriptional regulator YafY [Roseibium hamelinense]
MRRADRLFQIVQYLRGGRLVRAKQLGDWLEVSERTIYRDIADLQASGVPIDGAAGVGYIMRDGYDLPPLMFSRDEIVALVAGARLIRAWGGAGMARAAEEALIKIDAVLPKSVRARSTQIEVHAIAPEMTEEVRERIDKLEAAADARIRVSITYKDGAAKPSERTIRPLGLWFWGKVWTLVAWCELREAFRMFRLDRISRMDMLEGTFRPEPGKTLKDFYRLMEESGYHGP